MITIEHIWWPMSVIKIYLDGKELFFLSDSLVSRLAFKYANRNDIPAQLLRILTDKSRYVTPRLPAETHKIVRKDKCETSKGGFLDTHWKRVCLDRVVFDDRYQISLYEGHEYECGYYQYSSIRITSYVEVIDMVDNCRATRESAIPDTIGSDRFNAHLGNKIETVRVVGRNVSLQTSFGAKSNQRTVGLVLRREEHATPA